MKQTLRFIVAAWLLKVIAFGVLFALSGCAGRVETMRYTSETLPSWILAEWEKAQDELLCLEPPVSRDPRSISPYRYEWLQMEQQFYYTTDEGRTLLNGWYDGEANQIIVCCGYKKTVRHEAFHAILHAIGDPRWRVHYPDLLPYVKE